MIWLRLGRLSKHSADLSQSPSNQSHLQNFVDVTNMFVVLFLASLLTVEKVAIERQTDGYSIAAVNSGAGLHSSKTQSLPSSSDLETESIAAIQPNGDVEHIMLTKSQYEELKNGGTIKLGHNVRLRAKAVPS